MEWLSSAGDIVILVGAMAVGITNIYRFFANGRRGIAKKVKHTREQQEQAEEIRIRNVIAKVQEEQKCANKQMVRDIIAEVQDEQSDANHDIIVAVMKEELPDALKKHDIDLRDKYRKDREAFLHDIKDEVIDNIQDSLETVEAHETRMTVFTEVLKELLRERIMAIYGRNRTARRLEEHEKIELERSYKSYKSINGNSYIDEYYKRMQTWEVVPDDYQV